MEWGSSVSKTVFAGGKLTEILCGPWDNIVVEPENNSAKWLIVSGNVEINVAHGG